MGCGSSNSAANGGEHGGGKRDSAAPSGDASPKASSLRNSMRKRNGTERKRVSFAPKDGLALQPSSDLLGVGPSSDGGGDNGDGLQSPKSAEASAAAGALETGLPPPLVAGPTPGPDDAPATDAAAAANAGKSASPVPMTTVDVTDDDSADPAPSQRRSSGAAPSADAALAGVPVGRKNSTSQNGAVGASLASPADAPVPLNGVEETSITEALQFREEQLELHEKGRTKSPTLSPMQATAVHSPRVPSLAHPSSDEAGNSDSTAGEGDPAIDERGAHPLGAKRVSFTGT